MNEFINFLILDDVILDSDSNYKISVRPLIESGNMPNKSGLPNLKGNSIMLFSSGKMIRIVDGEPTPVQYIPLLISELYRSSFIGGEIPVDVYELRLSQEETSQKFKYILENNSLLIFSFSGNSSITDPIKLSVALSAKKRKLIPSDSAVIKLSGWFKIKDSLKGEVIRDSVTGDVFGQRNVFGVSSFGIISDELEYATDWQSRWFYEDFSVVATDYDSDLQNATVHIKNLSDKERTLSFTPVSWYGLGYNYKSKIDNTLVDLPSNTRLVGNAIEVRLLPNQDIVIEKVAP